MEYLNSVGNAVIDRSLQELIGALMVAFAIALAMAGLYALGRRKMSDSAMLVICLTIVSSLASMALAAGFFTELDKIKWGQQQEIRGARSRGDRRPSAFGIDEIVARRIMTMADTDGDHSLSTEEASRAADAFVRAADASGKGSLDAPSLANLIRGHMPPLHHESRVTPAVPAAEASLGAGTMPPPDDPRARGAAAVE